MIERVSKKHVHCPCCGKHLLTVNGDCSLEIPCPRCKRDIVGIIDDVKVMTFEERRGKDPKNIGHSRYSVEKRGSEPKISKRAI